MRIPIETELWNLDLDCLVIVAIFVWFTNWKWCNIWLHELLQQVILEFELQLDYDITLCRICSNVLMIQTFPEQWSGYLLWTLFVELFW